MKLRAASIANCRSIEHAELDGLGQLNVLIGRNNAGKSAFFHALWHLAEKVKGNSSPWNRTVRHGDPRLVLKLTLTFSLTETERQEFIRNSFSWSAFRQDRFDQLVATPLARTIRYVCSSVDRSPDLMHIESTSIRAEDGEWARIQLLRDRPDVQNPISVIRQLSAMDALQSVTASAIEAAPPEDTRMALAEWSRGYEAWRFPQQLLCDFLRNAFFFQPSRRSADAQPAHAADRLASDGSNLPQVLLRVRTNHEDQFSGITRIIEGAVPDIGRLHTPMEANQTRVGFRRPGLAEPIPLLDMGTGIQQLLMMAVLLETTGEETALFIEEPELNLHPGAQRFLLSRLLQEKRQIFLTTHSPVFVDIRPPNSIHKIDLVENRTSARRVRDADGLSDALRAIGAQNSDLLLSDVVLFVEGPSDREIFTAWSQALGAPLAERNVTVLTLGGGDGGHDPMRVRTEMLEGISRAAPIPHKFIVDRDERSEDHVQELRAALGERVEVLQRREVENFLLSPQAIRIAIGNALDRRGRDVPATLQASTLESRMLELADILRGTVLLKRIRLACARLTGGLFPREILADLKQYADAADLPLRIRDTLAARSRQWLEAVDLEAVVAAQRERLQDEWSRGNDAVLALAPGAEILEGLFLDFGIPYDKSVDGRRIALAMDADAIAQQVKDVVLWNPHEKV